MYLLKYCTISISIFIPLYISTPLRLSDSFNYEFQIKILHWKCGNIIKYNVLLKIEPVGSFLFELSLFEMFQISMSC